MVITSSYYTVRRLDNARASERLENLQLCEVFKKDLKVVFGHTGVMDLCISNIKLNIAEFFSCKAQYFNKNPNNIKLQTIYKYLNLVKFLMS